MPLRRTPTRDPAPRARAKALRARLAALLVLGGIVPYLAGAPLARADEANPDPWQGYNRGIFWFNEKVDIYFLLPIAKGWRFITPGFLRKGLTNFGDHINMPVVMLNDILQGKPVDVGNDFLRIFFNSTFGIGGLIDVASRVQIPENDEDFGQTLGYWGVPSGPYFVLPLLGPATVRDTAGRLGDQGSTYYTSLLPVPFWAPILVTGVGVVNLRAEYIDEIDENRREAFDYYVFVRNAYLQNRRARVEDRMDEDSEIAPAPIDDEDLYFFDDEEPMDDGESDGAATATDDPDA